MLGWLKPKRKGGDSLPPELVTAIDAATVVFRSQDEDGNPRCLVRVPGTGSWYFDGTNEAAERFQRMHDLPPATARKAARLLASVVASRNRSDFKQARQRRSRWVFSGWETL